MVEMMVESTSGSSNVHGVVYDNINSYKNMVMDAMRMIQDRVGQLTFVDEEPHADTIMFFDLLKDSNELLQNGCINHNKLSVVAHVFIIKPCHGVE